MHEASARPASLQRVLSLSLPWERWTHCASERNRPDLLSHSALPSRELWADHSAEGAAITCFIIVRLHI